MPKNKMDIAKLEDIGLDKKTADSIIKSFNAAEKAAKHPEKQTLQQLKKFASEAMKFGGGVKDKVMDFAEKAKPRSGQER